MDRADAARILGVGVDADEATIRAAFRAAAKLAHPDGDHGADGDPARLDEVRQARRILLLPDSQDSPRSAPTRATRPGSPGTAPTKQTRSGMWLAIAAGLFGLVIFGLVAIVAIAVFLGAESGGGPAVVADCVRVLPASVEPVPCSATDAQAIVSTSVESSGSSGSEPTRCPSGTNTLVTGETTYCLQPVSEASG